MQALARRSDLVLVMNRAARGSDRLRALVDDAKLAGMTALVARHGKVVYLDAYLDEASTCAARPGRIANRS